MDTQQRDTLIDRYLAMWHEPDAALRRTLVEALWAPQAENYTRNFVARGMAQIVARVDRAHAEWVAKGGFVFRRSGLLDAHNHLVKLHWEMVPRQPAPGCAPEAKGLDVFVLDPTGKISALYQFAETTPV